MLAILSNARIFFFQKSVDMRKGIEGLSALVEVFCSGELMTGAYFVFVNRSRDKMKVLYWIMMDLPSAGKDLKKAASIFSIIKK